MLVTLRSGQFYGATTKAVSVAGFHFTEKSYEPGTFIPRHAHELAHYCFVLGGSYSEKLGASLSERKSAALIYYPAATPHSETHHTRGRHFLIELEPWRIDEIRECGFALTAPNSESSASSAYLAAKLYREFHRMEELSILALEGITLELIAETMRHRTRYPAAQRPPWLNRVEELLKDEYSRPQNLARLAQDAGIHPVHLVRAFRKFQHCTIGEYIRRLRVCHARERILASNDSLVEIALSCGFADHSHFSRSFKRVTGMTPSEFRRAFRPR